MEKYLLLVQNRLCTIAIFMVLGLIIRKKFMYWLCTAGSFCKQNKVHNNKIKENTFSSWILLTICVS